MKKKFKNRQQFLKNENSFLKLPIISLEIFDYFEKNWRKIVIQMIGNFKTIADDCFLIRIWSSDSDIFTGWNYKILWKPVRKKIMRFLPYTTSLKIKILTFVSIIINIRFEEL